MEAESKLFDNFVAATTLKGVLNSFQQLCIILGIDSTDTPNVYKGLRSLKYWKAEKLWKLLDKRYSLPEYNKQKAGDRLNTLVIGAGPCGLRMAIECALLGNRVVVIEQRDKFSRNNVLHLWEFVISDIKALGAKIFYPKFCTGSIEHISIRQLQLILLKVALCFGVQVHEGVSFSDLILPQEFGNDVKGFRAKFTPENHILSEYEFDVLLGADGKRNTVPGFRREEMRGKLAIAITCNFVNGKTLAEEQVPEISGVAYIFNQAFFKGMYEKTGVDLENIVYYKDETHYFVMCAKKQSLLDKGVLRKDCDDVVELLSEINLDKEALCSYARSAADFATNGCLPSLEFAKNHRKEEDIAAFDFTSLYSAKHSCRLVERQNKRLLMGIVGDSLHEPFWPTGSGCARGFLGVFDTAWLLREYGLNKRGPLEVIAERESVYRLLAQVTKDNLHKSISKYTIDPRTRYLHPDMSLEPEEVVHLISSDHVRNLPINEPLPLNNPSCVHDKSSVIFQRYSLWRFCSHALNKYKLRICDLDKSWNDGKALAGLVNMFRPQSLEYFSVVVKENVVDRLEVIFASIDSAFGISPPCLPMAWSKMSSGKKVNYISRIVDIIKNDIENVQNRLVPIQSVSKIVSEKPKTRAARRATQPIQNLANILMGCSTTKDDEYISQRECIDRPSIDKLDPDRIKNLQQAMLTEGLTDLKREINVRDDCDCVKAMQKKLIETGTAAVRNLQLSSQEQQNMKVAAAEARKEVESGFTRETSERFKKIDETIRKADEKLKRRDICGVEPFSNWRKSQAVATRSFESTTGPELPPRDYVSGEVSGVRMRPCVPVQPKRHSVAVLQSDSFVGRQTNCDICSKVVYLAERMQVGSTFVHKNCFRCAYCCQPLRIGEYGKDKDLELNYPKKFFCNVHLRIPAREKIAQIEKQARRASNKISTVAPIVSTNDKQESVSSTRVLHFNKSSLETPKPSHNEHRSVISPISELLSPDDRTPERAEFGSHLEKTENRKTNPVSSDSDEEEEQASSSKVGRTDSDEEEYLEEDDNNDLVTSIIEYTEKSGTTDFPPEEILKFMERMENRRQSLSKNMVSTPRNKADETQYFTPTGPTVKFRQSPEDLSRVRANSIAAVPENADYKDFFTSSGLEIRKQKELELEELRSESRRKAQQKTDEELGLGSNNRYHPPTPTSSKPRSSSLLNDMPSMRRETTVLPPLAQSPYLPEIPSPILPVAQNNNIPSPVKPGMLSQLYSPDKIKHKNFNSPELHCESRKEMGILNNSYHRLRVNRGAHSPTSSTNVAPVVDTSFSVSDKSRVAAVPPSPRILPDGSEEKSQLVPNPSIVREIEKKAKTIIKKKEQEHTQEAQESQRNIEQDENRLSELLKTIEERERFLRAYPTNTEDLLLWLRLIKERDTLRSSISVNKLKIEKLKLHMKYRELNERFNKKEEMAEKSLLQEMLHVVGEKERVEKEIAEKTHVSKRSPLEDILLMKGYDFRNFENNFKLF